MKDIKNKKLAKQFYLVGSGEKLDTFIKGVERFDLIESNRSTFETLFIEFVSSCLVVRLGATHPAMSRNR